YMLRLKYITLGMVWGGSMLGMWKIQYVLALFNLLHMIIYDKKVYGQPENYLFMFNIHRDEGCKNFNTICCNCDGHLEFVFLFLEESEYLIHGYGNTMQWNIKKDVGQLTRETWFTGLIADDHKFLIDILSH
ncbi:hypothetical protein ACJX0J_014263, partial [Zea mays]